MRALVYLLLLLPGCQGPVNPDEADRIGTLVVMSFNTWGSGANQGKSIDDTVAAIRAVDPDIVGLQETRREREPCDAHDCPASGPSAARAIAEALAYYIFEQTAENDALWANAILSKYPVLKATENELGVSIDVEGRTVFAFNVHFTDFPYQPYQLLDIPYSDAPFLDTEEETIVAAKAARGSAVDLLIDELDAANNADAAFIFGDFNEPSFRDWTSRAADQGLHPIAVRYPTTLTIEAAGYIDAYRAVHTDEIAKPGLTWTSMGDASEPNEHHDRIDYIFAKGPELHVENAAVVGEKSPPADVVVTPWPSDHRAVMATVSF